MANTYTLKIIKLDVKLSEEELQNIVYQAQFRYIAESEDLKYSAAISSSCPIQNPDPENFIPFEDLTEQMVSDWISNIVDFGQYQQTLDEQITKKQYPTVESKSVPW
jgi:hypothetical protein